MSKTSIPPGIVVLSTFALVFGAGFFLLLGPQIKPLARELARVQVYLTEPALIQQSEEAQLETLAARIDEVEALLPYESDLYDLSIQVEALARQENVTITGLALSPASETGSATTSAQAQGEETAAVAPAGGVKTSTLGVSVRGSYEDTQDFIAGLTRLSRFVQIQDLTVTGSAQESGSTLTTQINAAVYNLPYGS